VEYLKEKGFKHYSARAIIEEEVVSRGLARNRDNTTSVANDLRATYGPHILAERLYGAAQAGGGDAVIESLRAPAEIEFLRGKESFRLWAIDADPRRRYGWIRARESFTDNVTFEKFMADEAREMHSDDPTKQNIGACIKLADHVFLNNKTKEDLWAEVDHTLALLSTQGTK
jgi:dephospho-CoA kinase